MLNNCFIHGLYRPTCSYIGSMSTMHYYQAYIYTVLRLVKFAMVGSICHITRLNYFIYNTIIEKHKHPDIV